MSSIDFVHNHQIASLEPTSKKQNAYTAEFKKTIVNLYRSDKTYNEIQKEYGISHSALANWIKLYSEVKIGSSPTSCQNGHISRFYIKELIGFDDRRMISLLHSEPPSFILSE